MASFVKMYVGNKTIKHEATPWFPPEVKPVHHGLYVVGSDELSVLMRWDGKYWRNAVGNKWKIPLSWRGWTGRTL